MIPEFFITEKDKYYCAHCKIAGHSLECFKANPNKPLCQMPGHTLGKCYKLHGFLPGHKFNDKGKSVVNMVFTGTTPNQEVVKSGVMLLANGTPWTSNKFLAIHPFIKKYLITC